MKITINVSHLAALMLFTEKPGSARPQICGVRIEPGVRMVATNGKVVGVFRAAPTPSDMLDAPFTIHLDNCAAIVNAAKAAKLSRVMLWQDRDGWNYPGGSVLMPPDIGYPPWRRVIPASPSGEAAQFDPAQLMLFKKASKIIGRDRVPRVMHNGASAALVMLQGEPDFIGAIMPHNMTHAGWPTNLAEFTAQPAPLIQTCV